ncbi:hypothetical protein GCM10027516_13070 [Niabella aquatica]
MGYEPVYEDITSFLAVTYQPQGQAVQNGGKIYLLGDTLYQVETDKGIHIIDISDKAKPKNTGFIAIKGCREVAVQGNVIFTNNYTELLALRLESKGLSVLKRVLEAIAPDNSQALPPEKGYFECPVTVPGKKITGWIKTELTDPKCFY